MTELLQLEYRPRRTEDERRPPKPMWAPGPWHREPDRVEWRHRSGLPLLMVRSEVTGAWCGYVGLPPEHPLHGIRYGDCALHLKAADCVRVPWRRHARQFRMASYELWLRYGREKSPPPRSFSRWLANYRDHADCEHSPESLVEVHGGLTYGDACSAPICHVPAPGESDHFWWLGFDCAHAGDTAPAMDAFFATLPLPGFSNLRERLDIYCDLAYVRLETERLGDQVMGFKGRLYCTRCGRRRRLERRTCKCGGRGPWILR